MNLGIEGLKVLVTAGGSGIGLHVARALADEGANVFVCDIDEASLDALNQSRPEIGTALCDVSDRKSVDRLFEQAIGALGGLDCLVNNAGVAGPTGPVEENDVDEWDHCIAVCLTGQFNCTRLAVQHLKKSSNPSIINLSSAAGKFGFRNRSAYSSAKWGVVGFTKTIARELGQFGVRCNAILPGIVAGDRIRRVIDAKAASLGRSYEEVETEWLAMASIAEMVTPEQLADMILFLASPRGRTISGQAISIDSDLQALV